jgi:hypothetical protein
VVISKGDCITPNDAIEEILTKEGEIPGKFQVQSGPY